MLKLALVSVWQMASHDYGVFKSLRVNKALYLVNRLYDLSSKAIAVSFATSAY